MIMANHFKVCIPATGSLNPNFAVGGIWLLPILG